MTLELGKGTVSGFLVTSIYPGFGKSREVRLTFDGVEVDQTYLAETRGQLRSLLDHRDG